MMEGTPKRSGAKTLTNCKGHFHKRPSQWQPIHLTSFLGVIPRYYESCLEHLLHRSHTFL